MNANSIWRIFEIIDELHKYLGFINILGAYIILKSFTKNKLIQFVILLICTILVLLIIISTNSIDSFSPVSSLILLTLLLPLVLYLILTKLTQLNKFIKIFEKVILYLAIFFFYTQAILGGCVIYSIQNIIARDYLRLESWKENGVFGTNIFPGWDVLLRTGYFLLATAIVLKISKPKFVKKVLSKFEKSLIGWHQKSIK